MLNRSYFSANYDKQKTDNEDFSVIVGSCLSVNLYVRKSLLSVASYPKVLQRYEQKSK